MHKLYEYACDELKALEKKAEKGNLSMQEIQYADTLAHLKKNLMKADEMMEDEFGEYSMAYYPMTSYAEEGGNKGRYGTGRHDVYSYARGRRGARRDNMGRYSRSDGTVEDLREVMENTTNEELKREIRDLIRKAESMM